MAFSINAAQKVEDLTAELQLRDERKYRRVVKCLGLLSEDPAYPGLASHPYRTLEGPGGQPIWESYVEQDTAAAGRAWWFYGPGQGEITVVDLGPHP